MLKGEGFYVVKILLILQMKDARMASEPSTFEAANNCLWGKDECIVREGPKEDREQKDEERKKVGK